MNRFQTCLNHALKPFEFKIVPSLSTDMYSPTKREPDDSYFVGLQQSKPNHHSSFSNVYFENGQSRRPDFQMIIATGILEIITTCLDFSVSMVHELEGIPAISFITFQIVCEFPRS
jgi:hypothetical protein